MGFKNEGRTGPLRFSESREGKLHLKYKGLLNLVMVPLTSENAFLKRDVFRKIMRIASTVIYI